MKKYLRITCWVVGVPFALLFLVMAISPVAIPVVNNHGQSILGRDLSVRSVFVNPFFGTVTIKDFHCKEADGMVDFVSFDRLHVQINWLALMGKHVNLRHIHLDNFSGEILSNEEAFNFTDIIDRFSSKDTTARDTTPSQWTVSLRDIRLHDGKLLYHDVVRDNKWSVENINLHVPGLYFGRQQSNAGLQFNLPTGGSVTVSAGYIMSSRRYALTLGFDEVNTNVALPLVQDYLKVGGLGALITGSIHIDGSLENVRDLVATGGLSLTGLQITDEDDEPVAGLDEVKLVIRRGDLATNSFLLDTVAISGITGEFERTKKGTTFSRLLREKEELPADTIKPDTVAVEEPQVTDMLPPLTWSARFLSVTAKDLRFVDKSMRKDFNYAIDTLSLSGENIASQGRNSLQLYARLSDGARLKGNYTGGLDLKTGQHRMNVKLTGVKMKGFSPYTEELFACPVNNGDLAVQIDGTVNNGKLASETKITMDQPEIGKKRERSKAKLGNVPLKLGIDMLKSAQGTVVLEVPVKGDITSPKFKLGKVIGRAIAKVFFGPLMGTRDSRSRITQDEMSEMIELLGPDTAGMDIPEIQSEQPKKRKRR